MDWQTILASVTKTGRLVVVDPATRTCSAASEIAAHVAEEIFDSLAGPIVRVTTDDTHVPFSPALEKQIYPSKDEGARGDRGWSRRSDRGVELRTEVRLPQLSMGMSDAEIVEWFVADGDAVEAGQDLVEIEAEKASVVVPAPVGGTCVDDRPGPGGDARGPRPALRDRGAGVTLSAAASLHQRRERLLLEREREGQDLRDGRLADGR